MEPFPLFPIDMPATYRICVTGGLEGSWAERLWGMSSSPVEQTGEPKQTVLFGEVVDQAALVGVINALYNMGHTVVSVKRILPDTALYSDETNNEA